MERVKQGTQYVNKYLLARNGFIAKKTLESIIQKKAPINLLFDSQKDALTKLSKLPMHARNNYHIFHVKLRD